VQLDTNRLLFGVSERNLQKSSQTNASTEPWKKTLCEGYSLACLVQAWLGSDQGSFDIQWKVIQEEPSIHTKWRNFLKLIIKFSNMLAEQLSKCGLKPL
jgi:hypothetical protein